MKKQRKKKKSPQDATLRNVRAANRKTKKLDDDLTLVEIDIFRLRTFAFSLIDILKSKRLLTPAQCRMLEDALR